jgi:dGTPase
MSITVGQVEAPESVDRLAEPRSKLYCEGDFERIVPATDKTGDTRTPFRRDWARLIHCASFRRLQGKTQLFPSDENDYFRNRLTHSLEVAQIATGIALGLNDREEFLCGRTIDTDVVNFAGLAHDLGHPPFGHNGEKALDALMRDHGGFEGNAQTLRILARLEKKETTEFPQSSSTPRLFDGLTDLRTGLNLTMRSLASTLKYDALIPPTRGDPKLKKGYYDSELDLIRRIKRSVSNDENSKDFRTVECSIMDLADDIAYSTYDLEDAFKNGFLSPISMMSLDDYRKKKIAEDVSAKMQEEYGKDSGELSEKDINQIFLFVFATIYAQPSESFINRSAEEINVISSTQIYARSSELCEDGYLRSEFTSKLVHLLIQGIIFTPNIRCPALSTAKFDVETFKIVEVLKRTAYSTLIDSNRLKMAEHRGAEIINRIFKALIEPEHGKKLLPKDWQFIYEGSGSRQRAVCDFIAGMTDRYCVEFYSRLVGINAPSIQKPY